MGSRNAPLCAALAAGWLLWSIANATAWATSTHDSLGLVLRWTAMEGPLGLLVCLLLLYGLPRLPAWLSGSRALLAALLLSFAAGAVWYLLTAQLGSLLRYLGNDPGWGFVPTWKEILLKGGVARLPVMGFFCLLFFAIEHWRQLAEQREQARRAQALAQQAQLSMLRYQLNPHFLFNALNSIRAMIVIEPCRARDMVTELSSLLRYSLAGDVLETTIAEEIRAVESYLAIQRVRFEERLQVRLDVEPGTLGLVVPLFLIHPLVENAVKHGMRGSTEPLHVGIEVSRRGEDLVICVANSGRLQPAGSDDRDGTGTGLANVRKRLALAFAERSSFRLEEREGWVQAEIRLPLALLEPRGVCSAGAS